jgi:hypothetical protein
MLKAEIVELLAETYRGPGYDGPQGRANVIKMLNKQPKYALEARLELLTAPPAERDTAVQNRKAAMDRQDATSFARHARRNRR